MAVGPADAIAYLLVGFGRLRLAPGEGAAQREEARFTRVNEPPVG